MECYECNKQVLELNKNSRCITCVTRHNDFNAALAEKYLSSRAEIEILQKAYAELERLR